MESLVDKGLAKSIGISNFNKTQIERLLENCRIRPANLQVNSIKKSFDLIFKLKTFYS